MEFKRFDKIPRICRDMVITEKIDGTNASVWVGLSDGVVVIKAGSRNRFLQPEGEGPKGCDNFGFAAWVKEHDAELIRGLGEGVHYGEWWGQGIQRGYGLKEKRFSLFNVVRWSPPNEEGVREDVSPECCHVVPVLHEGMFNTPDIWVMMLRLKEGGSVAASGYDNPEGVIVYHTGSRSMFKRTYEHDEKGTENDS